MGDYGCHLAMEAPCGSQLSQEHVDRLAHIVESTVDLDALLELAAPLSDKGASSSPARPLVLANGNCRVRVGVARDNAFGFCFNQ